MPIDRWLHDNLACPHDGEPLTEVDERLECSTGHSHRIVDGIPILLRDDVEHAHWAAVRALELSGDVLVNGAGVACETGVHPFVQSAIGGTNGIMYRSLIGNLSSYPIPLLCAVPSSGARFLDVGCNWGRWCIAACRAGFAAVGIDPSYEAVHAARAIARQLGAEAQFVVADARHLPFRQESFDFAFSYSVLQHLPKAQVLESLSAIRRVLRPGGRSMVQMPNQLGIRSLYHQLRRGFRDAKDFEVRYWSVRELEEVFEALIGPTATHADGFLTLNAQASDRPLLPTRYRAVVTVSESLRRLSETITGLRYLADSIYVSSRKSHR